jgi:GTP pyrophosphokinase
LPNGSTPIDFAYRVHSAVGNRMNGARVNGRIVPISYRLQNGDIVEIITSTNEHGPSRDWIDIARSSQAKNKIKQWFKRENREENIVRGRELVEKEIKRQGYIPSQLLKPEWVDRLIKRYNFNSLDDAYSAVGYDGISSTKLVLKLVDEYKAVNKSPETVADLMQQSGQEAQKADRGRKKQPEGGVLVRGIGNCLVRLSHCCNPVPGDPIVGYITRSRGVSVHREDCVNVTNSVDDNNRLVDVSWYEQIVETYQAAILVIANDRPVLLSDITSSIGELKIPIKTINAKVSRENFAMIDLILEINGKAQLDMIIRKLKAVDSVVRVSRSLH